MVRLLGTNVLSPITPFDSADTNPTHNAIYGKGGFRVVADTTERNAIANDRCSVGMLVYVISDGKTYQLNTGFHDPLVDGDWSEYNSAENLWDRTATTVYQHNLGDNLELRDAGSVANFSVNATTGDTYIGGKLTVIGAIDPTNIIVDNTVDANSLVLKDSTSSFPYYNTFTRDGFLNNINGGILIPRDQLGYNCNQLFNPSLEAYTTESYVFNNWETYEGYEIYPRPNPIAYHGSYSAELYTEVDEDLVQMISCNSNTAHIFSFYGYTTDTDANIKIRLYYDEMGDTAQVYDWGDNTWKDDDDPGIISRSYNFLIVAGGVWNRYTTPTFTTDVTQTDIDVRIGIFSGSSNKSALIDAVQLEEGIVATPYIESGAPNLFHNTSFERFFNYKPYFWIPMTIPMAVFNTDESYTSLEGASPINAYEGATAVKFDVGANGQLMLFGTYFVTLGGQDHTLSYYGKGDVGGEKVGIMLVATESGGGEPQGLYDWTTGLWEEWAGGITAGQIKIDTLTNAYQNYPASFKTHPSANFYAFYFIRGDFPPGMTGQANTTAYLDAFQTEIGNEVTDFTLGYIYSNRFVNYSLETFTTGPYAITGWDFEIPFGGTSTFEPTADAYDGDNATKITVDALGSLAVMNQEVELAPYFNFNYSFYAKGEVGGETAVSIIFDSSGNIWNFVTKTWDVFGVFPTIEQVQTFVLTTEYVRYEVDAFFVADDSDIAFATGAGDLPFSMGHANEVVYFDSFQLDFGASATGYKPEDRDPLRGIYIIPGLLTAEASLNEDDCLFTVGNGTAFDTSPYIFNIDGLKAPNFYPTVATDGGNIFYIENYGDEVLEIIKNSSNNFEHDFKFYGPLITLEGKIAFDTSSTYLLTYSTGDNRFEFNQDVYIDGDLEITGTYTVGTINATNGTFDFLTVNNQADLNGITNIGNDTGDSLNVIAYSYLKNEVVVNFATYFGITSFAAINNPAVPLGSGVQFLTQNNDSNIYAKVVTDDYGKSYVSVGSTVASSPYAWLDLEGIHTTDGTSDTFDVDAINGAMVLRTAVGKDPLAITLNAATIVEIKSDGKSYFPGLIDYNNTVSGLTATDHKAAIDELAQLIDYLLPDNALTLDGIDIEYYNTTIVSGYMSTGGPNNFISLVAGTSHDTLIEDATFNGRVPSIATQATTFNYADKGDLEVWIYKGGTGAVTMVETFDLETAFDETFRTSDQGATYAGGSGLPYTTPGGYITITSVGKYNDYAGWQKGNATINIDSTDFAAGENQVYVKHTNMGGVIVDETTTIRKFFYDTAATSPTSAIPTVVQTIFSAARHLSGLVYYTTNDAFTIGAGLTNPFANTYHATPMLLTLSTIGIVDRTISVGDPSSSGYGSPPNVADTFDYSALILLNLANIYSINARASCQGRDPFGSGATVQSASENRLVNTYSTTRATALTEYFTDEYRRLSYFNTQGDNTSGVDAFDLIPGIIAGVWTESTALDDGEAQCYNNGLYYPRLDHTVGYLPAQTADYSGFSGSQYYIRAMYDSGTPHLSGLLELIGWTLSTFDTTGSPKAKVEIKLPTQTGWLDLGTAYNAGTFTGIDGDGCRISESDDEFGWTAGGFSTAASGYMYIIRITLLNNTVPLLTNLTEIGW